MTHQCEAKDLVAPYGPSPDGATSIGEDIWAGVTAVSTLISIVSGIVTIVGAALGGAAGAAQALLGTLAVLARGAGFGVALIAGIYTIKLCLENAGGSPRCVAGIASRVSTRQGDPLFKFNTLHPYFDITTTCRYWEPIIAVNNPGYILYQPDNRDGSPILRAYIYDQAVCDISGWSTAGTFVGAAVGTVAFGAIEAGVAGLCAAFGPFCLIIALIAAVIFAIVAAVVGGWTFGAIAELAAGAPEDALDIGGEGIAVDQLVTVKGYLKQSGFDGGANVFWFTQKDTDPDAVPPSFAVWGSVARPYSHDEADAAFIRSDDEGNETYLEDAFCSRTNIPCVDFVNRAAGDALNTPATVANGWVITTEQGGSLEFVDFGAPANVVKLFVQGGAARITFDRPVSSVTAEVGWAGGNPVVLTAFRGNTAVGSAQAPNVSDEVHGLTVAATDIDSALITAEEGILVKLCAVYSE